MMDKIAILLPCFNESKTIEKVVRDFREALPEAVIYVYDNNSTDGTDKLAKKAGAVVRYEKKQGKGAVIRSMFRDIEAECYLIADGDDTYPASFAENMIAPIFERNADMVIGDRLSSTYYKENKRLFHNTGNKVVRGLINTLFKNEIRDIMTGYRAFNYRFVKTFPVLSKGFEIETEMTIHAIDKNLYMENVVIDYKDRPEGSESKLNTYSDGMKVLRTIVRLYRNYKPFEFLKFIAFILVLIAAILFIPVLNEYFKTGLVERFPTLIVSGFLVIAAFQAYFSGWILNVMRVNQRQQFELQFNSTRVKENEIKHKKDK